jgi:DNA-binding LacI/PurR family transcriptional regulator
MRRTFGIITNDPNMIFQRNVIAGASAVARERDFEIEIFTSSPTNTVLKPNLAGLLVIANVLPDGILRTLYEAHTPISLVSHTVPDLPIPSVLSNNRQGVEILMRHLVVECGRRAPLFICGNMQQNDGIQRRAAFEQETMRYNLNIPPEHYLDGNFEPEVAAHSVEVFLRTRGTFDSVVASDYLMAIAAMKVLQSRGYRVPDEICVMGFGDGIEAESEGLTTIAADIIELGRRGARQLIGQIEGLNIRGATLLSTELVVRRTTRIGAMQPENYTENRRENYGK